MKKFFILFFSLVSLLSFSQQNRLSLTDDGRMVNMDELSAQRNYPSPSPQACPSSNNLVTVYAQNNAQRGIMFDITAINCVDIKCFDVNMDVGTSNIEIYTKTGSHVGFETTPGAWTLVGTAFNVTGAGINIPTAVPIAVNVNIAAGGTQAFYITRTTPAGPTVYYTNGVALSSVYASDANMNVLEGTGKDYPFGASFQPRRFNGTIFYDLVSTLGASNPVTGNSPVCQGSVQTYTCAPVTGASNYTWTVPAGSVINTGQGTNTITVTMGANSGNVCVTPSNNCGPGTQMCFPVTVNPSPTATASGFPLTICNGGTTNISSTGGGNYSWSPSGSLNSSTVSNPVASPTSTTTYTVTVTNSFGCTSTATVTINVNPTPVATASSSPATVCSGSPSSLSSSGGVSYSWTPTTGLSNPTVSNPTATPTATTTYTVVVTASTGCTNTATTTVVVNPSPTANAGPNQTICSTSSVTLNGTGGGTYNWSPSTGLSCTTCQNPSANPSSTTTYTLVVTDVSGCTASATTTVSVNSFTPFVSSSANTVCSGSSVNLSVGSGASFTWTPAAGLNCSTCQNPVATPSATTTYTVSVTDANGCTGTGTVSITVNPLPNVAASATPQAICPGGSSNLSASGGNVYSWSPATGLNSTTISNPVATPTATTTYTVVVSDANGCTNTGQVTILVNPNPVVTVSSNPSIVCQGGTTTLNSSGGVSYSWSPAAGLSNPTTSNPTATVTATTTYTVVVTNSAGCTASGSVTVLVGNNPTAVAMASPAIVCVGSTTQFNSGGGTSYSWSPATGLSNSSISNPVCTPTASTVYTVTVTNSAGCTATATVSVTVTQGPTLAQGTATPETCGMNNGTATAGTVTGTSPFTYSWSPGNLTGQTVSGLAAGVYTVTVTDATGCSQTSTVTVGLVIGVNAAASATPTTGVAPLNVVFTNSSSGANNYLWDFGDANTSSLQNPTHTYTATGTYTVMLVVWNNNQACSDTVYLTIIVGDEVSVVLPNIFTPNGDNTNDVFNAQVSGVKDLTGKIFNRWGVVVGEWKGGPNGGWDGNSVAGGPASAGTYFYVLNATGFDDKLYEFKGFVQLLR